MTNRSVPSKPGVLEGKHLHIRRRLHFAAEMQARGLWPPYEPTKRDPQGHPLNSPGFHSPPIGTTNLPAAPGYPFLFVYTHSPDDGQRPRPGQDWQAGGVVLFDPIDKQLITTPRKGRKYAIVTLVGNAGMGPCHAGWTRFSVANDIWINQQLGFKLGGANLSPPDKPSVVPFSVAPRSYTWVVCPKPWMPLHDEDLQASLVAVVTDIGMDRHRSLWDSWRDRHVGRLDMLPNMRGAWTGIEVGAAGQALGQARIEIEHPDIVQPGPPAQPPNGYPIGIPSLTIDAALPAVASRAVSFGKVTGQFRSGTAGAMWLGPATSPLDEVACGIQIAMSADGLTLHAALSWSKQDGTALGSSNIDLSPAGGQHNNPLVGPQLDELLLKVKGVAD